MNFHDAISAFRAKAAAGAIINRKTGRPGPIALSRIAPILSNVSAAVRRAATVASGRPLSEEELLAFELDPIWSVLPAYALTDAEENGRQDPKKERSNVRLFVSTVTGRDIEHDKQPVSASLVLEPWRFLYDAIASAEARHAIKRGTARGYRRGLLRFSQLALANGVPEPALIPDSSDAVYKWALSAGLTKKQVDLALSAFRKAADLAAATDLPRAYRIVKEEGLGIKSLPDFPERLAVAGFTGDPRIIRSIDAVSYLAPALGAAVAKVVADGRVRGMSSTWADARGDTASWVVATLIRSIPSADLSSITWLDLWLERRPVDVKCDATQVSQIARYVSHNTGQPRDVELRSLMRVLLDASARRSYANSHLELANGAYEEDPIPVYTEKLQQHLETAWMVAFEYFGHQLQQQAPELWARARVEYESLLKHVEDYNRPRLLKGRKPKDRLPISWPQMVCIGLPYLARVAHEGRQAVTDRLVRVGHVDSRSGQQLISEYCVALRDWMIALLLTDDGMRIKNYVGAMANEQIIPTWRRTHTGEIVGMTGLTTRWSGLDHETVKPKVSTRGNEANARTREVTRAFFDADLAWDFWTLARPRALVDAGLISSVEEYDVGDDRWAVFITPRPRATQIARYRLERSGYETDIVRAAEGDPTARPRPPVWRGNFTTDMLSNIYGEALHRICVEALKRDLPAYNDPALTREWRGLFAAHINRTQIGCYFGGVRADWTTAMWLTNDAEATLRSNYVRLQAEFDKQKNAANWENPRWFDAVIDRALANHPGDDWVVFWRSFDPKRPESAVHRLTMPAQNGAPTRKRRARDYR